MAQISRDDVAHLAKLARVEMTPDELDHMATELDQILGAVKRVQEVATSDIAPSLTNEEALSGAPAKAEERFKVPQILGEE